MYNKLLLIQQEIGAIKKDATNPFFKSKYFDINSLLEQVKPVLNKHGVVLLQGLTNIDGKLALSTKLVNSKAVENMPENLMTIEFICPLPDIQDPQKIGSAITYFRRYALQSLLALEAEDDDANLASKPVAKSYETVADKKARQEQNKKDFNNDVSPF
jgi:hypothetical protein